MFRFTVILPCFNERQGLPATVDRLRRSLGDPRGYELLIVDDGSTDGTTEILDELARQDPELVVVRHAENRGYGAALKTGLRHSRSDCIAIIDADDTYPSESILALIERSRRATMVVGCRTGPVIRRTLRWFPKQVLRSYVSFLVGRWVPDMNSGLRVFSRAQARQLEHLLPDGFSFTTTITMVLMLRGQSVDFVDIPYGDRLGRSKIRPVRDTVNIARTILRTGLRLAPLRLAASLVPPGVLAVVLFLASAPWSGAAPVFEAVAMLVVGNLGYFLTLGFLVPHGRRDALPARSPRVPRASASESPR